MLPGIDPDTFLAAAHKVAFSPALVGGGSDTTWVPLGAWPLCPEDARLPAPTLTPAPCPHPAPPRPGGEGASMCLRRTHGHTANTETWPDPFQVPTARHAEETRKVKIK